MPISFRCPNCGRTVPVGRKCECFKHAADARTIYRPRRERPSGDNSSGAVYGSDPMYHSTQWRRLCGEVKERFNHMDIYSWYVLGRLEVGEIVHHVVPIRDDYERRFDIENLIYLTRENHELIHQIYAESDEKKLRMQQELNNLIRKWITDKSNGFSQS